MAGLTKEQLNTMITAKYNEVVNFAAKINAIVPDTKVNYNIDGQNFDWIGYQNYLIDGQGKAVDALIKLQQQYNLVETYFLISQGI